MINQYWKGCETLPSGPNGIPFEIAKIVFELDNRGIKPVYKLFYLIKPMMPRSLQIMLRRISAGFVFHKGYDCVEDIYHRILFDHLEARAEPFHFIWFWPDRMRMASLVTHDIETASGFRRVLKLADIDAKHRVRSSFKFVPEGYRIDYGVIDEIRNRGFEIAIHGLNHDGRLFLSRKIFSQKMRKIKEYAERWHTNGFRSPSLLRDYQLMKDFTFNWDSSFPDWDPYGPQPGGCRTIFPFFLSPHTVELPVTIMQDHTLFEILNKKDISIWRKKYNFIRSRFGLANIITHPDYIFKGDRIKYYREYLDFITQDESAWQVCPNQLANWWRDRDRSFIKKDGDRQFKVQGPASDRATIARAEIGEGGIKFSHPNP